MTFKSQSNSSSFYLSCMILITSLVFGSAKANKIELSCYQCGHSIFLPCTNDIIASSCREKNAKWCYWKEKKENGKLIERGCVPALDNPNVSKTCKDFPESTNFEMCFCDTPDCNNKDLASDSKLWEKSCYKCGEGETADSETKVDCKDEDWKNTIKFCGPEKWCFWTVNTKIGGVESRDCAKLPPSFKLDENKCEKSENLRDKRCWCETDKCNNGTDVVTDGNGTSNSPPIKMNGNSFGIIFLLTLLIFFNAANFAGLLRDSLYIMT